MPKVIRISLYTAIVLAGFILIMGITMPFGPGVTGDSVDYLSTADSLISSMRFTGYDGKPYIYWPPLYPILLAGISQIIDIDTLEAGRVLNAASFGAIVLLSGLLFQGSFDGSPIWFFIGILIAFTSYPILTLASIIASDPPFIVLILLYAILGQKFLSNPTFSMLMFLGILAGIAGVLRWHGIILITSVILLVTIAYRRNLKIALSNGFLAGSIAILPFLVWVLGRNYRLYGTLIGYRDTAAINYGLNLSDAFAKISHWLIPQQISQVIHPLVVGLFFVLLIILINWRSPWKNFFSVITQLIHIPWLIFILSYFLFVILTSIPYDHAAHDDRYYAPIYIFFMVVLILVTLELVIKPVHSAISTRINAKHKISANILVLCVLLIWAVYPGYRLYKYAAINHTQGVPVYNMYNTRQMQESTLATYMQEYPFEEGIPIYSNFSAAMYFHTNRIVHRSPATSGDRNIEKLEKIKKDWPPLGGAYLVWFLPSQWHQHYSPDELSLIADLTKLYSSPDGIIFFVQGNTSNSIQVK